MLAVIRFLMVAALLLVVPASAEVVAYEFTGAAVAGGGTIQGIFWFDTNRVLEALPIRGGTQWAFSPGGLGVSVLSFDIQNPENPSFHFVACQADVNGRDNFGMAVSGQVGTDPFILSLGMGAVSGDLFSALCQTLPTNLSLPPVVLESAISIKIGNSQTDYVLTALRRVGVQANPIPPKNDLALCRSFTLDITSPILFCFSGVPTGQWFDPPLAFGYEYRIAPGSLFTKILDFPPGFQSPFSVSVAGVPQGQFGPGQSVVFPSPGVSAFTVTGIAPLVDAANPAAFPIKLEFNAQTATFAMLPLTTVSLEHSTVYVADSLNHRILRSTDDGVTWTAVGLGSGTGLGQFRVPSGVTVNSARNIIFVADTGNNRIQRSIDGGLTWAVITAPGALVGQVNWPEGLAYDEANDKLYVADTGNSRIQVATNAGSPVGPTFAVFAGATAGTSAGQVRFPSGVAVDAAGLVYVADTGNNRIQRNTTGASGGWSIFAGATGGSAVGQMNVPTGIFVDSTGRVYVGDTGNSRVQINTGGTVGGWSVFLAPGTAAGLVRFPTGVVLAASGNVFVGDTGNSRVQKKPVGGGPAVVVGGSGQFKAPTGVR